MNNNTGRIIGIYGCFVIASLILLFKNTPVEALRKIIKLFFLGHFVAIIFGLLGTLIISIIVRKGKLNTIPMLVVGALIIVSYILYRLIYNMPMIPFVGL